MSEIIDVIAAELERRIAEELDALTVRELLEITQYLEQRPGLLT